MTDIGATIGVASTMVPGIAVCIVGMGMVLSTHLICKKMLSARKKKTHWRSCVCLMNC